MFVKLLDRKSKRFFAGANIDSDKVGEKEIREILFENNIHVDEFGNLRNVVGEFMNIHLHNVEPVFVCTKAVV